MLEAYITLLELVAVCFKFASYMLQQFSKALEAFSG